MESAPGRKKNANPPQGKKMTMVEAIQAMNDQNRQALTGIGEQLREQLQRLYEKRSKQLRRGNRREELLAGQVWLFSRLHRSMM
ncbi:MAG: hypothetical protein LBF34_03340 [Puniceicoccales bacterium]|nr:hypothetical protein [Puniceicoccales bacterium]